MIKDVRARHKLDDRRIFTLSWSSSGPAAYAIALRDKTPVKGSFVAMSVFKPAELPPLTQRFGSTRFGLIVDQAPDAGRASRWLGASGHKNDKINRYFCRDPGLTSAAALRYI